MTTRQRVPTVRASGAQHQHPLQQEESQTYHGVEQPPLVVETTDLWYGQTCLRISRRLSCPQKSQRTTPPSCHRSAAPLQPTRKSWAGAFSSLTPNVAERGGCWMSEFSLDHVSQVCADLQRRGYAVWTPEYRRVGDEGGGFPNTFLDASLAVGITKLSKRTGLAISPCQPGSSLSLCLG